MGNTRPLLGLFFLSSSLILHLSFAGAPKPEHKCDPNLKHPDPPLVPVPEHWLPPVVAANKLATKDVLSYMKTKKNENGVDLCGEDNFYVLEPVKIGEMPQFGETETLQVLQVAENAWNNGTGTWPAEFSVKDRITAIRSFLEKFVAMKDTLANTLQWEIGKSRIDSISEVVRTKEFIERIIEQVESKEEVYHGSWEQVRKQHFAFVRRAAVGITLALAPYNYPLNEAYATIMPALLMGNIVIVKIPSVGGLVHLQTFQALADTLPPGTINFIAGSGRQTLPAVMSSGKIDMLSFIGSAPAADSLIRAHPYPHRLRTFLQLEAKNIAVAMPEVMDRWTTATLSDQTTRDMITGALNYNGQRCTAIKLVFLPREIADRFCTFWMRRVLEDRMPVGLPWESHKLFSSKANSKITPLPNHERLQYVQGLIRDALDKGAKIVNKDGGRIVGGPNSTLMEPAMLYPVTPDMRVFHEEQFGPIIAVAVYDELDQVLDLTRTSDSAQQISIFTNQTDIMAHVVDTTGNIFGRINLNNMPGRGPDMVPFTARRSSGMGVMSTNDVLLEFSVPVVVFTSFDMAIDHKAEVMAKSKFMGHKGLVSDTETDEKSSTETREEL